MLGFVSLFLSRRSEFLQIDLTNCYLVAHVPITDSIGPELESVATLDCAVPLAHKWGTTSMGFNLWAYYTFAITFISIAIGDGRAFIETVVLAGIISPKYSAYTSL